MSVETELTSDNFADEWRKWHDQRETKVSSPGGDLTLTGTNWISDETVIEGVPGRWSVENGVVRVSDAAGLTVDGEPVTEAVLRDGQWLAVGDVALVIIRRGNDTAVRTYDPNSEGVRSFAGIDAFAPDPAWVVTAEFRPAKVNTTEHIVHTNSGREVDYRVIGTFSFAVDGHEVEMVGLDTGHVGEAHLTFRDATSGKQSYAASRFLFVPLPTAAGPVTLDFNRVELPPCAFSDAFICPLPPRQNILPFPVEAGEQQVRDQA
ncbi:DUF1684 domain-containing protein [Micromonospora sp. NBC_01699]|uniref:DUF1684 domain-containing protein n=1 Tax=Micromonospora sp. NBC_01699 TaxID=2975984 RepID=UPI002E35685F|nr:DUF1684 domain-containing protein [Micromonospora sp. NBC_01699]